MHFTNGAPIRTTVSFAPSTGACVQVLGAPPATSAAAASAAKPVRRKGKPMVTLASLEAQKAQIHVQHVWAARGGASRAGKAAAAAAAAAHVHKLPGTHAYVCVMCVRHGVRMGPVVLHPDISS